MYSWARDARPHSVLLPKRRIMPTNLELPIMVGLFTLVAAVIDFRLKRVPNYITVPAAVLGLAFHSLAPHGQGVWFALGGFGVGFALLLLPWIIGGGGMGDVKLLAALGAWLGPILILVAFAGSAFVAACGALGVICYHTLQKGIGYTRRRYLVVEHAGGVSLDHSSSLAAAKKRRVLPFAVPVAVSTWLLLAWMLLQSMK